MVIQFLGCNSISSQELPKLAGMLQLPHGSWNQDISPCCPCPFHSLQKNASHRPLLQLKVCQAHLCFLSFPHWLKCINSGLLLDYASVCWRGGGGTEHRASPADCALGICLLGLQRADMGLLQPKTAHRGYLAVCLVCLQLCGFI